jgi:RNA polymerase sigma-70 factor (ECF subfamily)
MAARRPQATTTLDDLQLEDAAAAHPQAQVETHELFAMVAELPADFRDALVAVDLLGLSYAQAARALRTREATITTRLHRARRRVARALTDNEASRRRGAAG